MKIEIPPYHPNNKYNKIYINENEEIEWIYKFNTDGSKEVIGYNIWKKE